MGGKKKKDERSKKMRNKKKRKYRMQDNVRGVESKRVTHEEGRKKHKPWLLHTVATSSRPPHPSHAADAPYWPRPSEVPGEERTPNASPRAYPEALAKRPRPTDRPGRHGTRTSFVSNHKTGPLGSLGRTLSFYCQAPTPILYPR